jgi:hypothetical protein
LIFEDRLIIHLLKGGTFLPGGNETTAEVFNEICNIGRFDNLDRLVDLNKWNLKRLLDAKTNQFRRPKVDIRFEITSHNNLALNWHPTGYRNDGETNLGGTDFLEFDDLRLQHSIGNNRLFLFRGYSKLRSMFYIDGKTAELLWAFLLKTINDAFLQLETIVDVHMENELHLTVDNEGVAIVKLTKL